MSNSYRATRPAINIVSVPINKRYPNILKEEIIVPKRIRRYTPAVTRVDEWTRADTGVGAAIAAGSQAEKGIWALFVILVAIRITTR